MMPGANTPGNISENKIVAQCINDFMANHQELNIANASQLMMLMTDEKKSYACIAIQFGIKWYKEKLITDGKLKDAT